MDYNIEIELKFNFDGSMRKVACHGLSFKSIVGRYNKYLTVAAFELFM